MSQIEKLKESEREDFRISWILKELEQWQSPQGKPRRESLVWLDQQLRTGMNNSFMMMRGHVAGRRSKVGTIKAWKSWGMMMMMEDQDKSKQQWSGLYEELDTMADDR